MFVLACCCVAVASAVASAAPPPPFVSVPAASTGGNSPEISFSRLSAPSWSNGTQAFLAVSFNPAPFVRVLAPRLANGSCGGYENTSSAASAAGCAVAMNGGPFVMGQAPDASTCLGYVVADGHELETRGPPSAGFVSFGLLPNATFVLGAVPSDAVPGFRELLTGFGWLVRDGAATPGAGGEIAPRTAVGVDARGRLMMLEADGCEKCLQGLTLRQTAEWMARLGAVHAINLDGGGSSVTYYNGRVVSFPTCIDVPVRCERKVTTSLCLLAAAAE